MRLELCAHIGRSRPLDLLMSNLGFPSQDILGQPSNAEVDEDIRLGWERYFRVCELERDFWHHQRPREYLWSYSSQGQRRSCTATENGEDLDKEK